MQIIFVFFKTFPENCCLSELYYTIIFPIIVKKKFQCKSHLALVYLLLSSRKNTHSFFISSTAKSNARLNLTNQSNSKQHLEAKLLLFEIYSHFITKNSCDIVYRRSKRAGVSVFCIVCALLCVSVFIRLCC